MGILDLLLPLINLLGQDMPDTLWPSLTQVHQRLHDIVAEAAWFTNGMRATRSVFWVQFPLPGELNDISHEHATDDIWKRSKREAEVRDVAAGNRWEAKRDEKLASDNPGQVITQAHREAYEATNRRPYVRRTAKVQVAMWPFIKRFTPMRERDAGDGAYNAGETITQIMKAQCVYYNGDDSDEADMHERLTLSEQIKSRRWAKWFTLRAFLLYALIFLLFLFITSPEVQQGLRDHPWGIGSSSEDQGSMKESRTATTVPGPVGSETPTVTKHKTVTSMKTETVTREPDRREDDDNNKEDDDDNKEDDDNNEGEDDDGVGVGVDTSGNVPTGEATAEKTASLKESLSSEKDKLSSEFSSKTEEIKSSLSSEMARLSSIESSVREGFKSGITDANSRRSDARQSCADESSSSRAHKSSLAKSRAAEESSKSKASRSSSSAANAASRSSAEESRESRSAARSSSSAANAAKSRSDKESRSSSRSSSSAEITAQRSSASLSKESRRSSESRAAVESRAQAEAESSAAAERAAASERSILGEAAASMLALKEEADQRIRSVLAEKEQEDRRLSSSFYAQQEKESGTIPSLTSEEGESGSSSASKKRDQGPEITTKGAGIETTVTVEPGVIVVAVTRTASREETESRVGTVADKGRQRPRVPGPKEEKNAD